MANSTAKGHLAALVTILIWGTTFISTKVLLVDFQPIEILFFRFLMGLLALMIVYPHRLKGTTIKQESVFVAAGLCGVCLYYLLENIALGFKVNNERAVQFRKWVNGIVKDYTIKGWVMDDERLKNGGSVLTVEYFDRLLEQIREIRLSERRFYQKITDIYATLLIMTEQPKQQSSSLQRSKTRCVMRFMDIQQRS